ncbi:MAG: hypothetical protein M3539_00825 [Acidobacteriota bacterium]|nr:hypothetical protein [Acidobacteriota bacterium]
MMFPLWIGRESVLESALTTVSSNEVFAKMLYSISGLSRQGRRCRAAGEFFKTKIVAIVADLPMNCNLFGL